MRNKAGVLASGRCVWGGSRERGWGCPWGREQGRDLWGKAWAQHLSHLRPITVCWCLGEGIVRGDVRKDYCYAQNVDEEVQHLL